MKVVKKYAIKEGFWSDDKSKWDVQFTFNLCNNIGQNYITALYGGKNRNAEISWKTVLNKMVQKNAYTEEEADNDQLYVGQIVQ